MNQVSMLSARGVHVSYPGGVRALDGVDLDVDASETIALVGESGSGKTTLLCCFNGLVHPIKGELSVAGRAVREEAPELLRRRMGYVPQDGGLLPHWTVARNVELVPWLLGWDESRRRARSTELLELVGLPAHEYGLRHPSALSGGQRQRVAFARALAADPDVVLLDEPFGALDALTRADLHTEFLRWKAALSKAILVVTHDLHEAFLLADRVAVMQAGRIHQVAAAEELRRAPATDYVAALLRRAGENA